MTTPKYKEFATYFRQIVGNYSDITGQQFLADTLMTSQSTISKILKGDILPPDNVVKQMDILWNVDISQKIEEAREQYKKEKLKRNIKDFKQPITINTTKPRLPVSAAAGSLSTFIDGIMREQCEEVPVMREFPDYDFTMRIKGNSMEPKYESGDEIALKKSNSIIEWGKDYVLDTEDGVIFKKIYEDGDNIRCVSYNNVEYPDFLVPKSIIYGYYRFIGLIRS